LNDSTEVIVANIWALVVRFYNWIIYSESHSIFIKFSESSHMHHHQMEHAHEEVAVKQFRVQANNIKSVGSEYDILR
jgi:hypothetical protein